MDLRCLERRVDAPKHPLALTTCNYGPPSWNKHEGTQARGHVNIKASKWANAPVLNRLVERYTNRELSQRFVNDNLKVFMVAKMRDTPREDNRVSPPAKHQSRRRRH